MTVEELVSLSTPPLKPEDAVELALGLLMEFRVRHLPVVDDAGDLVGVISEEQLLESGDPDLEVWELLGAPPLSARPGDHVFDVTKVMVGHDLTTLPVATEEGRYIGLVKRHDIFDLFARMLSTQEKGAIITLEIEARDYSLAQLVYTIEQNDVRILSIAAEMPGSPEGKIRVTLKLNVTDTTRVRHMMEHHGYRVVASFSEDETDEDLQLRILEFMRYLEV
jgi:acetoin utilization protein AcuB